MKLTGWTFEQIDQAPAWRLERLLTVDGLVDQVKREQREQAHVRRVGEG